MSLIRARDPAFDMQLIQTVWVVQDGQDRLAFLAGIISDQEAEHSSKASQALSWLATRTRSQKIRPFMHHQQGVQDPETAAQSLKPLVKCCWNTKIRKSGHFLAWAR